MQIRRLHSESEVRSLIDFHNAKSNTLVWDVETTSKDPRKAKLLDIQLSGRDADDTVIFSGDYAHCLSLLAPHICLIGHNQKYDFHVLFLHGVDLTQRPFHDTLLISHLLDENRDSYALDSFVQEYWHDDYKARFWSKWDNYQDAPQQERDEYACKDVWYTHKLYTALMLQWKLCEMPDSLLKSVHETQRVLVGTEIRGLAVDKPYLMQLGLKVKGEIDSLLPSMRTHVDSLCSLWEMQEWEIQIQKRKTDRGRAGVPRPQFNFDSSKQVQWLLYSGLNLPVQKSEKTKQPCADEAALGRLKDEHPLIPELLKYRGAQKIYGSFIEGTEARLENGRIYPQFHVAGTCTGRLSASAPNLQQLPREGGIRGIYIPEPGNSIISADYASLEIYIAASLTADKNLLRIVRDGVSMHDITAQALGIDRQRAKTLNFAEGYGCSHFKVAKILGIGEKEALAVHNRYWDTYSGQLAMMQHCKRLVDDGKPIITPWGRRRRFEQRKRMPWDKAYRQAWNFLVQSTGADCTNKAFVNYAIYTAQVDPWPAPWFPIHDEIVAEVGDKDADWAKAVLCTIMMHAGKEINLSVPLKAVPSGPYKRWED